MKYFRITAYSPEHDFCFIADSNGMYEEIWQFSSMLVKQGIKVLEITNADKFLDGNIEKVTEDKNRILIRATADGQPKETTYDIDGTTYKAIKVANKIYIPDITQTI